MVIVGLGLGFIVACVFFAWLGVQRLRASWSERRIRRSRVLYYKHQRGDRRYTQGSEPLRPAPRL
jgi:hypothetical protein